MSATATGVRRASTSPVGPPVSGACSPASSSAASPWTARTTRRSPSTRRSAHESAFSSSAACETISRSTAAASRLEAIRPPMRCSSWARARAWRSDARVSARSIAAAAAVPRCRARSRSSSLAACASGHTTPSTAVRPAGLTTGMQSADFWPASSSRRRSAPETRRSDEASAQSTMRPSRAASCSSAPAWPESSTRAGTTGAEPVACRPRPSDSVTTTAAAARRPRRAAEATAV